MAELSRVVFIGCGGRANGYTLYGAREQMQIVGVADPHAGNRRTFLGLNSLVGLVPEFDDWQAMLDAVGPIDGVVVTTPQNHHREPAVECMRRGYAVALEKPIAHNAEDCRALLAARRKYQARVIIGFVMRSAPFYLQARRWLDEGRVGRVVTIQADEIPHILTTSVMFRSDWRRWAASSGGSLLEKCCHDMDMLTWMAGAAPRRISSMAGLLTFRPNPQLPARCDQCHVTATCPYYLPPKVYEHPDMVKRANDGLLYKFTRDNSACIYNNGHDIFDHQVVQLEYDNGVLATLTMDFSGVHNDRAGRTLKIIGDRGRIWGRVEDNAIYCLSHGQTEPEKFEIRDDGSGHGGANRSHVDAFLGLMKPQPIVPLADLEAGYLSAMLCFAADQSATEQRQLDVSHLVTEAGLDRLRTSA